MDTDSLNVIITLVVNLATARMELNRNKFENMLKEDKCDKKEMGTLTAGYNKCLKDMNEVFMSIGEM